MTRTENDLRHALRELERRADQHGAPATDSILAVTSEGPHRRSTRWLAPLAAAAVVAAAAVTAVALRSEHGSSHPPATRAGGQPTLAHSHHPTAHPVVRPATAPAPAAILDDAAAKLDSTSWTAPGQHDFFYVRTTEATTWTSVSGTQVGEGRTADGSPVPVPACVGGHIVAPGESGPCTLNEVPHYLADAPTAPAAWDAYLEHMAPGAKAADAQGKIIVQVLHQDLVSPRAAAALLRYTESCPGLHALPVRPVAGEALIGVTCASMTNGSYGLAFDATTHAFVGFVGVTSSGQQNGAAEIIRGSGIVPAVGRVP